MKRVVSIIFIVLTNILILAHAIVPHHHHNKTFAAIVNILDEDSQNKFEHKHHHGGTAHHHDGNNEDCLMYEAEAAATLKFYSNDDFGHLAKPQFNPDLENKLLWAVVELYDYSFNQSFHENHVRRWSYITRGHTDFVACPNGLRAPPTC